MRIWCARLAPFCLINPSSCDPSFPSHVYELPDFINLWRLKVILFVRSLKLPETLIVFLRYLLNIIFWSAGFTSFKFKSFTTNTIFLILSEMTVDLRHLWDFTFHHLKVPTFHFSPVVLYAEIGIHSPFSDWCRQETWAGLQGEADGCAVGADEGDGPDPSAGSPAARRTRGGDRKDQGGWILTQRSPLHLSQGAKYQSSCSFFVVLMNLEKI